MPTWLKRVLTILGVIALGLIVWFGGPFAGYGGVYPLESVFWRVFVISAIVLLFGGIAGFRWWRRRRAEKALERALAKESETPSDGDILDERMSEALEVLKKSSGSRSYLYDLPWYVIIGPPGAGKTTALINSGLKFPLANDKSAAAIAGVGGTRYCDWWFTDEAVLIDTAGRYTTQDSDAESDKKSWEAFLQLLKKYRPKQPINGVILAISLEDLMVMDAAEIDAHSAAIRKRLLELHSELKVDFPVYSLFTKADLVSGFREYFGSFTEMRRRKVWGATFQTEDRKKKTVGDVPTEYDALVKRLTEELPDRLHEEPDPISRIGIFGFPAQVANLRERVATFLATIFEPTRFQPNVALRGFYFSSGTQEGTPIDQVLGSMGRSFGAAAVADRFSGTGKSFFLHDLLRKVIFAESGWVTKDMAAVRRDAMLRWGVIGLVAVVTLCVLGAWAVSYTNNRALIASTNRAMDDYRIVADPELTRTMIDDVDLKAVLEPLHRLRSMSVGYANRGTPTPTPETFGLSQRPRLVSSAETSYREALERMFRSRLILRLEQQIEAVMDDPIALYEALKVYLMLGGKAPAVDRDLILAWMGSDWQTNMYPGAANSSTRVDLEQHLLAMLDLGAGQRATFELNGPLIENAQRALARMNIADRAYALIRSTGYSAPIEDWVVVQRGGPDTALVFETIDGTPIDELRIPGLFTYSGFHDFFLDQLAAVADRLIEDQWVMGEVGKQQAVEEQFAQLGPQLLERYRNDFIESWEKVLTNIRFRQLSADKPQYQVLSALSAPTSPLRQIIQSIRDETVLTEERQDAGGAEAVAGVSGSEQSEVQNAVLEQAARRLRDRSGAFSRIGIDLALRKAQGRAGGAFGGSDAAAAIIPGANIEAFFQPWHAMVEGEQGQRPIDSVVQNFYEVYQNLVLSATNPSQTERANAALQVNVVGLRANASRLPRPLAVMVQSAAEDFEGDAAGTSIAQLNQMMNSTVTRTCQQIAANRYPFDKASDRDVTLSDFARLFAPDGIIDRFFAQNLAPMADMSGETWVWKADSRVGREMSNATLRDFQRAAVIRDAFFPTGGSMPNVPLTVQPNTLSGDAEMGLLEINGTFITSRQIGNLPATLAWPGATTGGAANITILPELPGRESSLSRNGPWALMRILDAGTVTPTGDDLVARFVIGGREVSYRFEMGTAARPLANPALSEFKCPAGL